MPMSPHRPALAGVLAAFIAALLAFGLLQATHLRAAPTYSNPIAITALKYEGQHGGQCWTFVQQVVYEATGRSIGFDYREGFFEAGATEILKLADVREGDIIQVAADSNTSPNADYPGLHTSIVLDNLGGGLFNIIDSNSQWDEVVRRRERYDPVASAAAKGLQYHIYRIPAGATTVVAPTEPPVEGDQALVNTPGDCLRLRAGPGPDQPIITCIPHRNEVTITGAAVKVSGIAWVPVLTQSGPGWMAQAYLVKKPDVPGAGDGPTRGLLRYRTFAPALSGGSTEP
ncbi:MAG: SH3 domain-containing protein [Chloroflexi bacterium]|nr:SH3 domain-containing protein [Chloroflexota bacterium]